MMNRYLHMFIGLLCASSLAQGQFSSAAELDVNNVRARFNAGGLIGMHPTLQFTGYEVPKTPPNAGPSPLFAAGLWIGGLDDDDSLRFAGEMYRTTGHDLWSGPLGTNAGISQATSAQFDRFWKTYWLASYQHLAYFHCLTDPDCDVALEFPNYTIPEYFFQWPAHGDVSAGQSFNLADFYDFNQDGQYDPNDGDAPCFSGDQALFHIYNDRLGAHTESGGGQIGVEVHLMPFAYASNDPAINNTVFVRYRIFNRGAVTLHNAYIGLFADFDLGCADDDYLGSDVGRNLMYVYNGDNNDEDCHGRPGYGQQPPAFGIAMLQGPLMDADGSDNTEVSSLPGYNGTGFNDGIADNERHGMGRFIHFHSSASPTGDPTAPEDFYGYLQGEWRDGTPLTYGGNGYSTEQDAVPSRFAFPGESDPMGVGTGGQVMAPWTEASAGNAPGDRRGIASMGPFTFEAGSMQEILLAFIYARASTGGPEASLEALRLTTDTVKAFAETTPGLLAPGSTCEALIHVGLPEADQGNRPWHVHPNPVSSSLTVELPGQTAGMQVRVLDAIGHVVIDRHLDGPRTSLDVSSLKPGLYLLQVQDGATRRTTRFVKE